MRTYIFRRLLAIIPMFFLMTGVFFGIQNLLPGGPVDEAIAIIQGRGEGRGNTQAKSVEDIQKLRKELEIQYGLDKPVTERYWKWVVNITHLEFGESTATRQPAIKTILERLPISLGFGIPSFFLTYLICIPLGVGKALRDGKAFDTISSGILFVAYSIPPLVVAVVLLLIFCTDHVLPGGAIMPLGGAHSDNYTLLPPWEQFTDFVTHMALPVAASMLQSFTVLTLLMKNSLLEVISLDYVRTARSKGLTEKSVIFKHALRNAILPLAVGIGSFLGIFLAGSVVIERVFGLPGIGRLLLESTISRDYNVLMGTVVLQALALMLGQLISDVAYVLIDPRIDFN